MKKHPQRLTQVGILRALTWPVFFLSTFLGSRVTQPAAHMLALRCIEYCQVLQAPGGTPQTRVNGRVGAKGRLRVAKKQIRRENKCVPLG